MPAATVALHAASTHWGGGAVTFGTIVNFDEDVLLNSIGVLNFQTNSNTWYPRVYRVSSQALVGSGAGVAVSGTGRKTLTFSSPVLLSAGVQYVVALYTTSSGSFGVSLTSSQHTHASSPLIATATLRETTLSKYGPNDVWPNTNEPSYELDAHLFISSVNSNPNTPTNLQRTGLPTDTTPNFSAAISDPDTSQQIKARFEVFANDSVTLIGTIDSTLQAGTHTATAEFSAGLGVGEYKVRAKAIDDAALESGYTGFVSFIVKQSEYWGVIPI